MTAAQGWLDEKVSPEKTVCIISPENAPSIRLAERLGFWATGDSEYQQKTARMFARPRPA